MRNNTFLGVASRMATFSEQIQAVKDRLRAAIFRGEIAAGVPVHEAELRLATGASVRAVRQALVDLAREGLLDRKRHVGTFVHTRLPASREPGLPKISSVSVVSALIERDFAKSLYIAKVLAGIRSALHAPGKAKLFLNTGQIATHVAESPPIKAEALKEDTQGAIALELNHSSYLDELVRAGLPLVAVDYAPANMTFDAVAVDHQGAGFLPTAHLLSLGHRRIAFVGEGPNPSSGDPTWQDRLTGYLRAMACAGGETPAQWILNIHRSITRIELLLPDFHRQHRPTAYVLSSSHGVAIALKVLAEMNLACPRDVSLVACDAELHRIGRLELSSVNVDYEQFGRMAVELLAARLACRAMPPVRYTLPVDFHSGDTSAPVNAREADEK